MLGLGWGLIRTLVGLDLSLLSFDHYPALFMVSYLSLRYVLITLSLNCLIFRIWPSGKLIHIKCEWIWCSKLNFCYFFLICVIVDIFHVQFTVLAIWKSLPSVTLPSDLTTSTPCFVTTAYSHNQVLPHNSKTQPLNRRGLNFSAKCMASIQLDQQFSNWQVRHPQGPITDKARIQINEKL